MAKDDLSGPWPIGMNNRLPAHSLHRDQYGRVVSVRNVVNADIDHQGNFRRRQGYTKVYSGLNTRDGFDCEAGHFFIEANTLKKLNADNTATALDQGWFGPITYSYFNSALYLSDGLRTAKVVNGVVSNYADMPPCSILKHHNGRLYGAAGKTVWYTDPFVDAVDAQRNFLQFPSDVTVIASVTGGIWIVADKTYFFRGGGPENFVQEVQLEYGAVPGTAREIPNSNDVTWFSVRGVTVATQDGAIKNVQEENVAPDTGTSGASIVREENGVKQLITTINNPTVSPMAARDWMDMEIVRRAS